MGTRSNIIERIGYRIRTLRNLAGITQAELADRSGLSRSFLTRVEAGSVEISLKSLEGVAGTLGVTVGQIVGDSRLPSVPEESALAALQTAVIATKGVPIRLVGSIPGVVDSLDRSEEGEMVHVPKDWIDDEPLASLFVLDVGDGIAAVGIPDGTRVFCRFPDFVEPRNGDLVVVRINGVVTLKRWERSNKIIQRDPSGESMTIKLKNGDLATVIGFVKIIWTRLAS